MSGPEVLEQSGLSDVHSEIAFYYTQKIQAHGPTPLGVDWPCQPTQELRFVQLLRLCDVTAPFSLNDVGCGYGALLALTARRYPRLAIDYLGVDLSAAMVASASRRWRKRRHTSFAVSSSATRMADYSIASGIFNVKLNQPEKAWEDFIRHTLGDMAQHSRRGFAVNFLAPLADGEQGKPELYRASAGQWVEYCAQQLGARVELLSNYGMREYTLLARLPGDRVRRQG